MGMKIPGIGEVKPTYVYFGVGTVGAFVVYGLYKKRKNANAAAAAVSAAAANQANTGIDPVTNVPYSQEGGVYGYGGTDPATGIPYQYENQQPTNSQQYTTNAEWASSAELYAQSELAASQTLAEKSVRDYLAQPAMGLPAQEYDLMSEIIALIGPPPIGTFKLAESPTGIGGGNPPTGGTGATGGTKSLAPGEVLQIGVLIKPPATMQSVATHFGISLQHLINNNPGSSVSTTGVVNVPYLVKQGDSLTSIAARFGISPEHLAQELSSQGII